MDEPDFNYSLNPVSEPIYRPSVDAQEFGNSHGLPRRAMVGCGFDSITAGSRSLNCRSFGTDGWWTFAIRGCRITVLSWGDMG